MIMTSLIYKAGLVVGSAGLLAVGDLPPGWQQLGVAGASLFVLIVSIAWVFPRVIAKIMDGHARANERLCDRIDELIRDVLSLKGGGRDSTDEVIKR